MVTEKGALVSSCPFKKAETMKECRDQAAPKKFYRIDRDAHVAKTKNRQHHVKAMERNQKHSASYLSKKCSWRNSAIVAAM